MLTTGSLTLHFQGKFGNFCLEQYHAPVTQKILTSFLSCTITSTEICSDWDIMDCVGGTNSYFILANA